MSNLGFLRLRLQSHARIKRLIDYHEQRVRQRSNLIDKKATCKYNAHSAFLLCAVNPSGSCSQCQHYEPESEDN